MRLLLMTALGLCLLVSTCWGQTYSCRDASGQLHFADSLQGLPEECRGKENVVKPGKVDNLNFVPQTPVEPGVSREFQESVEAADQRLLKKQQLAKDLKKRAEELAQSYQQAVTEKRKAKRRWDYQSREIVIKASNDIEEARLGKQRLLKELEVARIASEQKKAIQEILTRVKDSD